MACMPYRGSVWAAGIAQRCVKLSVMDATLSESPR